MYRSTEVQEVNADALIHRIRDEIKFSDLVDAEIIAKIAAHQSEVLQVIKEHGAEHPATLIELIALAELYIQIEFYHVAEDLLRRSLLGNKRTFGMGDVSVPKTMCTLAFVLSHQGKGIEADALYKEALSELVSHYGESHPEVMRCVEGMGLTCFVLKRLDESEAYFKRLLKYWENTAGKEHPTTLKTVNTLGKVYQAQGKYAEAIALCQASLECCQRTLGNDHPTTQAAVVTLAQIRHYLNDSATAEQMYRLALSANEKTLGPDHEDTLVVVCLIASLLSDQTLYTASQAMYERALAGYETTLGPNSLLALQAHHCIGTQLLRQLKPVEAMAFFTRAHEGRVKYLGETHASTLASLFQIAQAYHMESAWRHRPESKARRVLAEETLYRALKGFDATLGRDHAQTIEVAQYLADFLIEQNNPLPAEHLFRRIYTNYCRTLDAAKDLRIGQAAYRLGDVLDIKRAHEEAAEYFLTAHRCYSRVEVVNADEVKVGAARFSKMVLCTSAEQKRVLLEDAMDQHKNSLWRLAHG